MHIYPLGASHTTSRPAQPAANRCPACRLSQNQSAYEELLAWKRQPFRRQAPGFQRYLAAADAVQGTSPQCRLCNLVAESRVRKGLVKPRSHCLRNETWLQQRSSWGSGAAPLLQAQRQWEAAMGGDGAGGD